MVCPEHENADYVPSLVLPSQLLDRQLDEEMLSRRISSRLQGTIVWTTCGLSRGLYTDWAIPARPSPERFDETGTR